MSDQPDSLLLVYLRRLDERTPRMEDRLNAIERQVARVAADFADFRLDVIDIRARMERRLDLHDVMKG